MIYSTQQDTLGLHVDECRNNRPTRRDGAQAGVQRRRGAGDCPRASATSSSAREHRGRASDIVGVRGAPVEPCSCTHGRQRSGRRRGVPLPRRPRLKARSVARCANMLRRRRRATVMAGQQRGRGTAGTAIRSRRRRASQEFHVPRDEDARPLALPAPRRRAGAARWTRGLSTWASRRTEAAAGGRRDGAPADRQRPRRTAPRRRGGEGDHRWRRKGTEAWRSIRRRSRAALGKKLSACASCGRAWYWRQCQKSHWKSHKASARISSRTSTYEARRTRRGGVSLMCVFLWVYGSSRIG